MLKKILYEVVDQVAFVELLKRVLISILQEYFPSTDSPLEPLYTTKQMYEHLNIGRSKFLKLLDQGQVPGIRIGNQWRFEPQEVVEAFKATNVKPDKTSKDV